MGEFLFQIWVFLNMENLIKFITSLLHGSRLFLENYTV